MVCAGAVFIHSHSSRAADELKTQAIDFPDETIARGTDFLNPERGFFSFNSSATNAEAKLGDVSGLRPALNRSLSFVVFSLEAFRNQPLSPQFLAQLSLDFSQIRAAGIKAIVRFAYGYRAGNLADASSPIVKLHIRQLAPLLTANSDVIALLQAGFIGQWGEWHDSANGLEAVEQRTKVIRWLLAALPADRMIALRYPWDKYSYLKQRLMPTGPLAESEGYNRSDRARLGFHNDCFLTQLDDEGSTNFSNGASGLAWTSDQWKRYASGDALYTSYGGETCEFESGERASCSNALTQLESGHWNYLNADYFKPILNGWKQQGCYDTISKRLGYRFRVTRLVLPAAPIAAGSTFALKIKLVNDGFGSLYNRRPVFVVLSDGVHEFRQELLGIDPRNWKPGQSSATIKSQFTLPYDTPPGDYRLSLWLPDQALSLRDDPRYSVRLSNPVLWTNASGLDVFERSGRNEFPSAIRVLGPAL